MNTVCRRAKTHPTAILLFLLFGCGLFLAGCKGAPTKEKVTTAPAPTPSKSTVSNEFVMFDGTSMRGWAITDFAGHGEVQVEDKKLILGQGVMTGVTWTNELPRMNYEVNLDAMRVDGSDFFCGLTFPVGKDSCSLIVGGWGGGVVGLSSLDGEDAANNDTTQYMNFETGRWYHIRLLVKPGRIQAWIDEKQVVDANVAERKISVRVEVEPSIPFGIAAWSTTAALRDIRICRL
jgi:hypothetical protein